MVSKKILIVIVVIAILLASAYGVYGYAISPVDADDNNMIYLQIPQGYGTTQIANLLSRENLIKNVLAFRLYARINNLDGKFKEGEYYLNPSMTMKEIVEQIVKGSVIQYRFTIPEGYNVRQIAETLARLGYVDEQKFLEIARTEVFDLPFEYRKPNLIEPLEGYLFPDTYSYHRGMDEIAIINMMIRNFNRNVSKDFNDRAEEMGYSMQEIITIASLIEREAQIPGERKTVSSVIYNRLSINMRLQFCASVMYILPEPKSTLLYSDLEIDSPYNTYRYGGLPPGPIASPGLESIRAALYPDDTPYFYFVARGDGSHVFTRTLAEHNRARDEIRGQ